MWVLYHLKKGHAHLEKLFLSYSASSSTALCFFLWVFCLGGGGDEARFVLLLAVCWFGFFFPFNYAFSSSELLCI